MHLEACMCMQSPAEKKNRKCGFRILPWAKNKPNQTKPHGHIFDPHRPTWFWYIIPSFIYIYDCMFQFCVIYACILYFGLGPPVPGAPMPKRSFETAGLRRCSQKLKNNNLKENDRPTGRFVCQGAVENGLKIYNKSCDFALGWVHFDWRQNMKRQARSISEQYIR